MRGELCSLYKKMGNSHFPYPYLPGLRTSRGASPNPVREPQLHTMNTSTSAGVKSALKGAKPPTCLG